MDSMKVAIFAETLEKQVKNLREQLENSWTPALQERLDETQKALDGAEKLWRALDFLEGLD